MCTIVIRDHLGIRGRYGNVPTRHRDSCTRSLAVHVYSSRRPPLYHVISQHLPITEDTRTITKVPLRTHRASITFRRNGRSKPRDSTDKWQPMSIHIVILEPQRKRIHHWHAYKSDTVKSTSTCCVTKVKLSLVHTYDSRQYIMSSLASFLSAFRSQNTITPQKQKCVFVWLTIPSTFTFT